MPRPRTLAAIATPTAALAAALLAAPASASLTTTVTLQPGLIDAQDATVYQGFPTENLSGGSQNPALNGFTGFLIASQTTSGNDLEALARFELQSLDLNPSDITSVTLDVYAIDSTRLPFPTDKPTADNPIDVTAFEITDNWTQNTVTWNSVPYDRTAQGVPNATAIDTQRVDGINQWISFDVTDTLRNALNDANTTVDFALASPTAIASPDSGNEISLVAYAAESAAFGPSAAGLQPRLTFNLVPEPAAAFLLTAAAPLALRRRKADTTV